jgi:hypothetical protein
MGINKFSSFSFINQSFDYTSFRPSIQSFAFKYNSLTLILLCVSSATFAALR